VRDLVSLTVKIARDVLLIVTPLDNRSTSSYSALWLPLSIPTYHFFTLLPPRDNTQQEETDTPPSYLTCEDSGSTPNPSVPPNYHINLSDTKLCEKL